MDGRRGRPSIPVIISVVVFVWAISTCASAQGLPQSPYSAPSVGGGLDLVPSNPFGMPGTTAGLPQGSNSLYLNSGMFKDILPPISNLEIGYLYQFGNVIRTGRLTLDYVLPATIRDDQAIFGEAHGEFTNFWKTLQRLFRSTYSEIMSQNEVKYARKVTRIRTERGYPDRIDLSLGGGYRRLLNPSLMLGVNGFYDTTKLGNRWYGSGGLGLEMATLGAGNDLVELSFNYYGDIFQGRNSIINAFRNGPSNFDVSARYSIELGDYGPDLRLKATGYQFDIGIKRYGWATEAEVRTRNGMFSVKAGTGHDPVNGWYHTVGGFLNVGLDFANLLNGGSPFEKPEPIFRSPRSLRRLLTQKIDRKYLSPPHTVAMVRTGVRGDCLCDGSGLGEIEYVYGPVTPGEIGPGAASTCDNGPNWTPTEIGVWYNIFVCVQTQNTGDARIEVYFDRNDGCPQGNFLDYIFPGYCSGVRRIGTSSFTAIQSMWLQNLRSTPYNPGSVTVYIYREVP